jgi:ABC-type antimicrobial peptide transport system permease subunit
MICNFLSYFIFFAVVFLWAVWKIINLVVPKFFKKMIRWEFPPFKELHQAGIFGLIDALLSVFFSTKSINRRLEDIAKAFGKFIDGSVQFMGPEFGKLLNIVDSKIQNKGKDKNNDQDTSMDDKVAKLDDQYNLCVLENTTLISDKMTDSEKTTTTASNEFAKIKCKLEQIKQNLNSMSKRM